MKIFLVSVLLVMNFCALGSDTLRVDLRRSWLMDKDGKFVPHTGDGRVVYLDLNDLKTGSLLVSGKYPFSLFLNNSLVHKDLQVFKLPVGNNLKEGKLAIYSSSGLDDISIEHLVIQDPDPWQQRPNTISSALIMLTGLLIVILIILVRTTGTAALEYFNFLKVFSVRAVEDSALTVRITSANNLFFYLFCSALISINLVVLDKGKDLAAIPFWTIVFNVLMLMLIVFLVLASKIMLIGLCAALFKLTDFGPTQFYNYVRLLLISFIFCSATMIFLLMLNVDWVAWRDALSYFIAGMSLIFVCVTYLKLLARGGFTVFHLFSYLCASEIVPFIILLNIYFS